jgi:hypothetical protein
MASKRLLTALLVTVLFVLLSGCQRAYFGAMERLGFAKRDILVDRVEDARDSQVQAKEQFASALDRFRAVVGFEGGDLEEQYDILSAEYERSRARADEVRTRVDRVEHVAGALFAEWEDELGEYSDAKLRRSSKEQLVRTRERYRQLITAMRRAENGMDPVLETFQDQVLFLKHNLNARAIASLEGELAAVEADVRALVRSMEQSIGAADEFIKEMQ